MSLLEFSVHDQYKRTYLALFPYTWETRLENIMAQIMVKLLCIACHSYPKSCIYPAQFSWVIVLNAGAMKHIYSAKPSAFHVCFAKTSALMCVLVHSYSEMKIFNFKNFVLKLAITLPFCSYVMLLCWHGHMGKHNYASATHTVPCYYI